MKEDVLVSDPSSKDQMSVLQRLDFPHQQRVFPQFSTPRLLSLCQLAALVGGKLWDHFTLTLIARAYFFLPFASHQHQAVGHDFRPNPALITLRQDDPNAAAAARFNDQNLTSLAKELDQTRGSTQNASEREPEINGLELRFYEQLLTRFVAESGSY